MNRLSARTAFALLLAAPLASHATEIAAGTAEYVTARDCIAGPTSACDDVSPIVMSQYGGNGGAFSSAATETFAGYGSASGSVSLSGTIGAPVLHASASSLAGKRVNTNSVALQSYTYTGAAATTRTFGGTLTYNQLETGFYPDNTGVYAVIDAFTLTAAAIDVGTTPEDNFNALFNADFSAEGYVDVASMTFADTSSNPAGSGTFSVDVPLTPGETIWLRVLLQTPAANGSVTDASHTLITRWNDGTDLTPAVTSTPVPEPSSLAMLALGLAATAFAARRQRG
ncbi:PEP-CTERM sorting domain-containing protein [Scleromatobacter humisilvae]|uniref:PEP-CTERM sorting domain-containing protein n=1 Tax=Scleromatobacter humisilvae TaxID=2897159 RepID=A0A9X1YGR5_9BURK|nr:PEP-CTERM sorting domain-containing protein [Scleromatobacter humisilvae]MCK9684127.1 PEP-CTERM sorting domain-containing protein [Scleromatobacter humisilvae]